MTFLNAIMLIGLAGMAIPIIIHLLNRRRAKVVDWGAMQFLEASVTSRSRRIRMEELLLLVMRALLLAVLALALARPFVTTGRLLVADAGDAQDIAIVLDGSLSMTLASEGKSSFRRAVDEAKQILDACRRGDAVSVTLAGPTAQPVLAKPISDLQAVRNELDALIPPGGSMDVPNGLNEGIRSLASGGNPAKKVILITDGQRIGWDLTARKRWSFLADEARESLPTPLTIIVRTLDPPRHWRNACVSDLHMSRAVVGTDRPVKISVTIANTGVGAIEPEAVELSVDGLAVKPQQTGEIAEGASATVLFAHHFEQSGPHTVRAKVLCSDDLPGDNQIVRVVKVLRTLPVLVVEGEHSTRPLGSDAAFLRLALAPPKQDKEDKGDNLIRPKTILASEIASVKRFDEYKVVILADVPRLPAVAATALADFVHRGGGLLIAPGEKASSDFYNAWNCPDRKRLTGCRLVEFLDLPAEDDEQSPFVHVAPNTIDHPALKLLADPSVSDLASAQIRRRWVLAVDEEKGVSVGATLDNTEPYLIQRKVGRGFVLTLSVPLDREFSDLPVHQCYLPMVHELVYYLAAPSQQPMNIRPGQRIAYAIPGKVRPGDVAEVFTPSGRRQSAKLEQRRGRWLATYAHTAASGLYRLALPDAALGDLATRPAVARNASGIGGVPFVVLGNAGESRLDLLVEDDYRRAKQFVNLRRAETFSELIHAIQGGVPGSEIWRYLAILCAAIVVMEIFTARAIAVRRQAHRDSPVAFGTEQVDPEQFRKKAREMLEAPPPDRKEVRAR